MWCQTVRHSGRKQALDFAVRDIRIGFFPSENINDVRTGRQAQIGGDQQFFKLDQDIGGKPAPFENHANALAQILAGAGQTRFQFLNKPISASYTCTVPRSFVPSSSVILKR